MSSGSVRLDASKIAAEHMPQAPPDRCWIIISAIEPSAMPRNSSSAISHARKN